MMTLKQRLFITTSVILTFISLLFVPWNALKLYFTPLPATIEQQLDDVTTTSYIDGIMVYVDKGGEPARSYASGWKDRQQQIPADPKALFKIASITKLYVATAVTKLVYHKQLSLEKTLAQYLPELRDKITNADKISLRMLVQHRSGIPNFSDRPEYSWGRPLASSDEAIALIFNQPADFDPDSSSGYSNTNYLLLGKIIDTVLGYSYDQYIKAQILQPLGLTNTYNSLSEVDPDKLVSGYDLSSPEDLKMLDFKGAAGSMIATTEDVGIFIRALNSGNLLNQSERKIYASLYPFGHTGLLPGYSSIAYYHQDIDSVVVMTMNTSGERSWAMVENTYDRIVEIIRTKKNAI